MQNIAWYFWFWFFFLPAAGFATNSQVTVVTNTSWSATGMVVNTNTTESGAPMLSPSRCSRCVGSSNEACRRLSLPLTLHLLFFLLPSFIFIHSPCHSCTFWGFPIEKLTQCLFCCQIKKHLQRIERREKKTDNEEKLWTDAPWGKKKREVKILAVATEQRSHSGIAV